jgi:DNA adenine methylase
MKTTQSKPFVKWAGGKTQLIKFIEQTIPKNFEFLTYVESFIGGGAVLFWMLKTYPKIKKATISDINQDLVNAYKTIKTHPKDLILNLGELSKLYNQADELSQKRMFMDLRYKFNSKILEPIENASILIFLNKTCFNGLWRVNSNGEFNVPFGKKKFCGMFEEDSIYATSEALQKVEILCDDFENVAEPNEHSCFFYFDPPYKPISSTSSFTSYDKSGFNDLDQSRLKALCSRIDKSGNKFVLSNSSHAFFDDLYSEFNVSRVDASRRINSKAQLRGPIKEIIVSNFNHDPKVI